MLMNSYFMIYKFNELCINKLKEEYKNKINYDDNKSFLYSNLIEISKFYEFNSYKFNPSIYFKFKEKPFEFFKKLIEEIRLNSYSKDSILLLYSLLSYYVISNSSFFADLSLKDDKNYFKEKSYYNHFRKAHRFNLEILDILDKVVSPTYNILMIRPYLKNSLNKFYLYADHTFLFKLRYFSKLHFSKKIKLLNVKTITINKVDTTDILDNFNMLLATFTSLVNACNEALYFNNYKKLEQIEMTL